MAFLGPNRAGWRTAAIKNAGRLGAEGRLFQPTRSRIRCTVIPTGFVTVVTVMPVVAAASPTCSLWNVKARHLFGRVIRIRASILGRRFWWKWLPGENR